MAIVFNGHTIFGVIIGDLAYTYNKQTRAWSFDGQVVLEFNPRTQRFYYHVLNLKC